MPSIRSFPSLQLALSPLRAEVVDHALYRRLATVGDVRCFMEHHVFAVWDFMSLLKSLQRELTCVEVPWVPRGDGVARRLLNEIVLAEESDEGAGGGYASHFELYRSAMGECGADTSRIDAFVERVACGEPVRDALLRAEAPEPARRFVASTFETIESGSIARVAAAFTLGREDVIPDMFRHLVADLSGRSEGRLGLFLDYVDRHIRLDGERHAPMAARLLEALCAGHADRWPEALAGARDALIARRRLWDGIADAVARVDGRVAAPAG